MLAFALPEKLRVRLVIVIVHRLPFFALRLHLLLTRRPLTARVIATLTLAACESVAFSVVPFLAVKRLEPSLTADSVGGLGEGGGAVATSVCAIPAPHAEATGLSDRSPP